MRKYNGSYTIPIKKHTKMRRPMSIYRVAIAHYNTYTHELDLAKDIYTRKEVLERINKRLEDFKKEYPFEPHKSLPQRIKGKRKR